MWHRRIADVSRVHVTHHHMVVLRVGVEMSLLMQLGLLLAHRISIRGIASLPAPCCAPLCPRS